MSVAAEPIVVDLGTIHECQTRLDERSLGYFVSAAEVCIERHHDSELFRPAKGGVLLDRKQFVPLLLVWDRPTDAMIGTHANDEDAAKDGAYAIVIVLAFRAMGLRVLGKRKSKDGADWVAEVRDAVPPRTVLIEVSGLLSGDETSNPINKRLAAKEKQILDGKSGYEGIAFVVDFRPSVLDIRTANVYPPSNTK